MPLRPHLVGIASASADSAHAGVWRMIGWSVRPFWAIRLICESKAPHLYVWLPAIGGVGSASGHGTASRTHPAPVSWMWDR